MPESVTWEQVFTWVILAIIGAGGIGGAIIAGTKRYITGFTEIKLKELESDLEEARERSKIELEEARQRFQAELEAAKLKQQSELEEKRSGREFEQEEKRLTLDYARTEATESQRMFGEIISDLQGAKEKGDEFTRSVVSNRLDKIDTHIQEHAQEVNRRLTSIETRQRLLTNWLTGGKLVEDDEPIGDYDAWIKSKSNDENPKPPTQPAETVGDRE